MMLCEAISVYQEWLSTSQNNFAHNEWSAHDICDCLSENPPSSHLPVFREIPF